MALKHQSVAKTNGNFKTHKRLTSIDACLVSGMSDISAWVKSDYKYPISLMFSLFSLLAFGFFYLFIYLFFY